MVDVYNKIADTLFYQVRSEIDNEVQAKILSQGGESGTFSGSYEKSKGVSCGDICFAMGNGTVFFVCLILVPILHLQILQPKMNIIFMIGLPRENSNILIPLKILLISEIGGKKILNYPVVHHMIMVIHGKQYLK